VDDDHSLVLLIPVSDYKAFTGNFADAKTEGDLTEVKFPNETDASYVTPWGKYAAVSPSKEVLGKKPAAGVKLKGLTAKELSSKDAIVYVNMVALRAKLLPELKNNRDEMLDKVAAGLQGEREKYIPIAKSVVSQFLTIAQRYLEDASSVTYGVSFTPTGISGTLMTEFQPGTYGESIIKKFVNSDDSMLAGIPNSKYIFFGGAVATPEVSVQLIDDAVNPIMKDLTALGDDAKPAIKYLESFKKMTAATKSGSFGMLAPSGNLGQDSIIQFIETVSGDSKAIGDAQKTMTETQQELMNLFQSESVQQKVTFTAASKTVDGVALDEIKSEFAGDPNNPQAAQMQQMMKMMYGPDGVKVLSGAIDDQTRVISIAAADEIVQQLITAAKTKDTALAKSDTVTAVSAELPKKRVMVAYFAVDNLITTGLKYASAMGMNLPINLPPNQPPIGMSIGTEEGAIRVDTFVPTQLVKSITAAVIQFQMQMQGGGQGGGM